MQLSGQTDQLVRKTWSPWLPDSSRNLLACGKLLGQSGVVVSELNDIIANRRQALFKKLKSSAESQRNERKREKERERDRGGGGGGGGGEGQRKREENQDDKKTNQKNERKEQRNLNFSMGR